jgi:hypothetical protein
MRIIESQIQGITSATSGSFDYAFLNDRCELALKNDPVICDERDDFISLKDGKYRIENGILYIKAKRIFWKKISRYCEEVDVFGLRKIYLPNESFQENVENPPRVETVIIKRWWRNNKKIQAIELFENDPIWYKQKQEAIFEIAIENFRLNESAVANEIRL